MRKLLLGISVVTGLAGAAASAQAIDLVTGGNVHVRRNVEVLVGPRPCHMARGHMIRPNGGWRSVCVVPTALVVSNQDCQQAGGVWAEEQMPNGSKEQVCIYAHGDRPWPPIWDAK